jgi:hypothetical protein
MAPCRSAPVASRLARVNNLSISIRIAPSGMSPDMGSISQRGRHLRKRGNRATIEQSPCRMYRDRYGSVRARSATTGRLVSPVRSGVALPKQGQDAQIESGVHDRLHGQWLIIGERRDEIISCLVGRHGWAAQSTPDGRRVARAPR